MPVSISVKPDVNEKELFDKGLKRSLIKQIEETVEAVVKKHKGDDLVYEDNSKQGWVLNVTVASITLDDPAKPKRMDGKIQVVGMLSDSPKVLKASAGGYADGLRPNKLEDKAKTLVNDVLEELLNAKIIPGIVPK